jgi:hypothetical protein
MASETSTLSAHDALFFSTFICAIASAMLWTGKLSGAEWVSTVTWVSTALILGKAAAVAASGFAVSAQAKATAASSAKEPS